MKNEVDYRVNIIYHHCRMRGYFVDELKMLIVTDTLPKFTEYVK